MCLVSASCVGESIVRDEDGIARGYWSTGKGGVFVFRSNAGEWVLRADLNHGFFWKEGDLDIARGVGVRPALFPKTQVFPGKAELLDCLLGYPELIVLYGREEFVAASSGELRSVDKAEFVVTFWPWFERVNEVAR